MKIKTLTTLTALIIALSPLQAKAQDFYNGLKGPRITQLDSYTNLTEQGRSYLTIPKLFTGHIKGLPDLLFAAPFSIGDGKVENKGFNVGYVNENKFANFIAATGIFKDGNGKYNVLIPQLYVNKNIEKLSLDVEGSVPINLNSNDKSYHLGFTPGYEVKPWLRAGFTAIKNKGEKTKYHANLRFELKDNHQFWLQTYIGRKHSGVKFLSNF